MAREIYLLTNAEWARLVLGLEGQMRRASDRARRAGREADYWDYAGAQRLLYQLRLELCK